MLLGVDDPSAASSNAPTLTALAPLGLVVSAISSLGTSASAVWFCPAWYKTESVSAIVRSGGDPSGFVNASCQSSSSVPPGLISIVLVPSSLSSEAQKLG